MQPQKIAAIDLDQFTVDSSARAERAALPGDKLDWQIMFSPELILELDRPIPEMVAALWQLKQQNIEIWYVTSREQKCQEATVKWLARENYPDAENVICRPAFTKTVVFKANAVKKLHEERGTVVLFADNDQKNLDAIAKLDIKGITILDYIPERLEQAGE